MTSAVVDASVALAWGLPDEQSEYSDAVFDQVQDSTIWVTAIWSLEIANSVLMGERKRRFGEAETLRFFEMIESLNVAVDPLNLTETLERIVPLAREHQLTAYDASYLELALRKRLPLATLDQRLAKAATRAGVATCPAKR